MVPHVRRELQSLQGYVAKLRSRPQTPRSLGTRPDFQPFRHDEQIASWRQNQHMAHHLFQGKWRTREDSNLWPLPSEGSALSS